MKRDMKRERDEEQETDIYTNIHMYTDIPRKISTEDATFKIKYC